ncbi:hypothetical protein C9422_18590 [Pseudomonas sp. B1(2018)]|uniref:type II toxin-antitoxin system MqsR family toxin n=1 Tax=Pseudomonas sp. B1(2018) TaxID=2233856 RepID=UPI000D5DD1E5|nr:hypothetical protein C9422_18590 [Pseudomonas sp. B1(2018)]
MVNTTSKPRYDLRSMQRAAKEARGLTITPRARQDAENLGYDLPGIRSLVARLEPSDFDHVWILKDDRGRVKLDIEGKEIAMDVYSPWIEAPNGDRCRIYLKMKLTHNTFAITSIQSFHQKRK